MVISQIKKYSAIVCLFVLLGILLPSALAETKQVNLEAEIMAIQKEAVGQKLTGPVGKLFGDEQINVHLVTANGEEMLVGIITEEKEITALGLNQVADPSLDVYTDEKTAAKILVSANPLAQLQKALGEKKITYKASGFFHKIKIGVLDMFIDVVKGVDAGATEDLEVEIIQNTPAVEKKETPTLEEKPKVAQPSSTNDLTGGAVTDIPSRGEVWTVQLVNYGFDPEVITVKTGDTIQFRNMRSGSLKYSQLIGTQSCRNIKSAKLQPEDTFEWSSDKPLKCFFTDAYMTTKAIKVVVE